MFRYDEADLVRDLARLGNTLRVAFAASCAERLLPAFENFRRKTSGASPDALAGILERVWEHLLGNAMSAEQICAELNRCMTLIPPEDEQPWIDEQAYADDAASSVAYTLRTLERGSPQEAAWAARCGYEAADHYVQRLGIEESQVMTHPIVQAEISRQLRDLEELLEARQDARELFARLRNRARIEASTFPDP